MKKAIGFSLHVTDLYSAVNLTSLIYKHFALYLKMIINEFQYQGI